MKNKVKLVEWTRLIQQRSESGKTVKAWCEEQGIRLRQYNYWLRRVREAAVKKAAAGDYTDTTAAPASGISIALPVVPPGMKEFARIELARPALMPAMSIRIGVAECEVYNGADPNVIERAFSALVKIC
jgi:hypothetical protein